MRLVLLGPPGAGKGTQAAEISQRCQIPHISTGDMLREQKARGTALGVQIAAIIDSGQLVPDELMLDLVEGRLEQADAANGWLLDGFPRTVPQAEALETRMAARGRKLDRVIEFDVDAAELVRRLSLRRVCPKCKAIYHLEAHPPQLEGVCDVDGAALMQRADDHEGVIRERQRIYQEKTAPLVGFYSGRGLLVRIDGARPPAAVQSELGQILKDMCDEVGLRS